MTETSNGIAINDIVVNLVDQKTNQGNNPLLKGDILMVHSINVPNLWFKADGMGAYPICTFRLASMKEIVAYKQGIKNIKDMIIHEPNFIYY